MSKLTKYGKSFIPAEKKVAPLLQNAFNRIKVLEAGGSAELDPTQFVKTIGDQNINGIKTFNNVPKATQSPLFNDDLTRKDYVDGQIRTERDDRIQADDSLQTAIETEESARELAINNLQNTLVLKEILANKINEIVEDSELKFYNTANAVYNKFEILKTIQQNQADLIPYVKQGKGDSEEDVMSQKAVTLLFEYLETLIENISDSQGGTIELPDIDLSDYLTATQVHAAIKDITGDLINLLTANKLSLIGAINENHARINNNVDSIAGLQTDIGTATQDIVNLQNADANLQTQINARALDNAVVKLTGNQTILGLKTFDVGVALRSNSLLQWDAYLDIQGSWVFRLLPSAKNGAIITPTSDAELVQKHYVDSRPAFITHEAANEQAGLTYSANNPNVLVYWEA